MNGQPCPAAPTPTPTMRRFPFGFLVGCVGAIGLSFVPPARAVKVSAAFNTSGPYTNSMVLGPKGAIFDPGVPAFTGLPSLPAPPLFGTSADAFTGFAFGTPLTAVQMGGDALSSITQVAPNTYDLGLTLTNFTLSSISLPANEYVYLNIWESFTGLPLLSTATWSGSASISGSSCRTSLLDGLFIEPAATVYDPGSAAWIQASTFFGGMPAGLCGPIAASATVNPLTPYISGGSLMVGFEVILGLNNNDSLATDFINLPTSLDLNLRYQPAAGAAPVPGPLPAAGLAMAWRLARRMRQRLGTTTAVRSDRPPGCRR